jgi:AraC-like DNA-binding protein
MVYSKAQKLADFQLIENLLEECYNDPNFCVEKMAQKLGLSLSYFRDIIEYHFQICPQKLIEIFRLCKSLKLLEEGLLEYQIIKRIGYSSTRTFRRAFKNRFGILPSEYKKLTSENNIHYLPPYLRKLRSPNFTSLQEISI